MGAGMGAGRDLLLAQLVDMGYGTHVANVALNNTGGSDLSEAVMWLLEHPEAADLAGWTSIAPEAGSKSAQPEHRAQGAEEAAAMFSPLALGAARCAELQARAAYNSGAVTSGQPSTQWNGITCNSVGSSGTGYPPEEYATNPLWQSVTNSSAAVIADHYRPPSNQPEYTYMQPTASGDWQQQQQQQHMQQQQAPLQQQPARPGPELAAGGVGGLLAREQARVATADRVLDSGLHDLQALMSQAQDLVSLAEQFRLMLTRQPPDTADDAVMASGLADDLVDMGIEAPVTKESSGKKYYQQLSRELAGFLKGRLEQAGGMMTLPDVFCLFNRARGTELVSPDDLLQAVDRFGKVGAAIEMRELPDGVRVLQSLSHSREQVCARIAQLVKGEGLGPALSISSAAAVLRLPIAIAQEHLLTAESCGTLCRDDGPEGLRFFRNFFADVPAPVTVA